MPILSHILNFFELPRFFIYKVCSPNGAISLRQPPQLILPKELFLKVLNFISAISNENSGSTSLKYRFDTLINQHSGLISRICFSYSTDEEDYKDLYQDVLINLWKGLENFRGESSSTTWIYRVALNTCVSTFRKRKNRPGTQSLDSVPIDIADESDEDNSRERLEWLHRRISELNPIDKAIVTMWLDDRSYNEIAEVVGMSPNNIGLRLHRIKSTWRKKGVNI